MEALILEDDRETLDVMCRLVRREGYEIRPARSLEQARESLARGSVDLAILDLQLPDGLSLDLMPDLQSERGTEVVLVTGHASVETAVDALKRGARDYLEKPIRIEAFRDLLRDVRRTRDARRTPTGAEGVAATDSDDARAAAAPDRAPQLLGDSSVIRHVRDLIEKVGPTEASVVVTGPTGSGKEVVARMIHACSRRAAGPWVAINCGALAPTLVESELFGHEKGAFTGAQRKRRGLFERASGGTLFLDEVTETSPELQVKLLRVLESGESQRLGSDRSTRVDLRIIAATNRDPLAAIDEGSLREDLFYRLGTFRIDTPALADHREDIPALVAHFLAQRAVPGEDARSIDPDAIARLSGYGWPGNVRELRNVIERAGILTSGAIGAAHIQFDQAAGGATGDFVRAPVGTSIRAMERRLIEATLEHLGGDKPEAARRLGISLKTLYNRLNAYGGSD